MHNIFISHTYFIALLGSMNAPAANRSVKPGMISSQQNPHTGINSVTELFERLQQALWGQTAWGYTNYLGGLMQVTETLSFHIWKMGRVTVHIP